MNDRKYPFFMKFQIKIDKKIVFVKIKINKSKVLIEKKKIQTVKDEKNFRNIQCSMYDYRSIKNI